MINYENDNHRKLRYWTILGAGIYAGAVLIVVLTSHPKISEILLTMVGGCGAWIIFFKYFSKGDINYMSWPAKHGEAPMTRLFLLLFALAWILLSPWYLMD